MANQVEVKERGQIFAAIRRPVIFTDTEGNEYRVNFANGGGITINKLEGAITITPSARNQVTIN